MCWLWYVLTGLGLLETVAQAPAVTVSVGPAAATRVFEGSPDTAYGGAASLVVERSEFLEEGLALLRFDLTAIPPTAVVTQAELQLYLLAASDPATVALAVFRAEQPWSAASVTWNTRPALDSASQGKSSVGTVLNRYYSFDVTSLVSSFVSARLKNYGLAVRGPPTISFTRVFMGNGTANSPRLRVVYTLPTPTRTPTESRTATPTSTSTRTATRTPTSVATATATATVLVAASPTHTSTPTRTLVPTTSPSSTGTATPTRTPTQPDTSTPAPSASATPSFTYTATPTASSTATRPPVPTLTQTATATSTASRTPSAAATHSATATASLTPASCAGDAHEPNDTLPVASPIEAGVEYRGIICPPGDQDFFKVSLQAGTRVRVRLYGLPADYQLALFGPGGQWLDDSSNKGRQSEEIRYTATASGDFYVRVAAKGLAHEPTQPYALLVTLGEPPVQAFPGLGIPGAVVRLHGEGLDPVIGQTRCEAAVYWDQATPAHILGRTLIHTDGAFDLDVRVPSDALPGTHRLPTTITCGSLDIPVPDVLLDADTGYPDDGCVQTWPPPLPDLDLTVLGMEVTQGIQCFDPSAGDADCADNSVPLVANRPTVVRLYVGANLANGQVVSGVTARLYARRPGDAEPGTPLWPANGPIGWRSPHLDTLGAKRATEDGTLNFRLPPEWITAGPVILRAEVNPDWACGPYESNDRRANNWGADLTVSFADHGPLTIAYLPVEVDGEGPDDRVNDAWQWLYRVWPVGDPPSYRRLPGEGVRVDYDLDPHPESLIADLNEVYAGWVLAMLFGGPPPPRILFGWAPTGADPRPAFYGYSDPPWDEAVQGISVVAWHRDMPAHFEKGLVHECAHNFNQHHAGVRPPWPYDDLTVQEVGFDTAELVVKPANLMDVMNTGFDNNTHNAWISPFTYQGILAGEPWGTFRAAHFAGGTPREYALIRGEVRRDGTGRLHATYRIGSAATPPVEGPVPGSDYCVTFLGDGDRALASRCFNASFVNLEGDDRENPAALDTAPFALIEPYPAETRKLRLLRGASILDEQGVSLNAPQIAILSPNGGEQWDGQHTIVWQASDADGDPLEYSIFSSPDDGRSWRLIAAGMSEAQLSWDTSLVGGGDRVRVRVLASDGINTGLDDSDEAFRISLKPPSVRIASPRDGEAFRRPEAVILVGQASDPEDGELRGDALVWRSDRDGVLGTGNHIVTPELSRGMHVITLTATDSDDATAAAAVTISIQPRIFGGCAGDCGGDGAVTVDDLVTLTNIALDLEVTSDCLAGDLDADGQITVDEILAAVTKALNGCIGARGLAGAYEEAVAPAA